MAQLVLSERTQQGLEEAQELVNLAYELNERIDEWWAAHMELAAFLDFTALLRADHKAHVRTLQDQINGITRLCEELPVAEDAPDPEPEMLPPTDEVKEDGAAG